MFYSSLGMFGAGGLVGELVETEAAHGTHKSSCPSSQ